MRINQHHFGCRMAACAAMILAAALGVQAAPAASADSAAVTAVGPGTARVRTAPAGQHGFPYDSTSVDLKKFGYVEEEYFISGTAQAYVPVGSGDLSPDGRWNAMPNPGVVAPYTTRILVRRPRDVARFNGTVVVEWLNESGTETASDWIYLREELLSRGYAYVGVSAQYHGVKQLQGWENGPGARYASLFSPGDSFDYNIFAQAGWAVEHSRDGDPRPLGNLTGHVRTLLATGFSQSALWLVTYVNSVHRLAPVYQGFMLDDGGVDENLSLSTADPDGDPAPAGVPATPDIYTPYPFQLRNDQHVPVMIMQSELGLSDYGVGAARTFHLQPDTPNIRVWEFTGAAHLEAEWLSEFYKDANKSALGLAVDTCGGPPTMPTLVHGYGSRAALQALTLWAERGRTPPIAPRMSLNVPMPADDFDDLVTFNRDPATNLTLGGIRLPAVSVPIATLDGNRSDFDDSANGPGFSCGIDGAYDPWNHDSDPWDGKAGLDPSPSPEPELLTLYPTHERYVGQVLRSAGRSLLSGYLLPEDAAKIVIEAGKTPVP